MSVRLAAAFRPNPITVPLSAITLTPTEESGDLARAVGMRPDRFHQAPAREVVPHWSVRFVHPPYGPNGAVRQGVNSAVTPASGTGGARTAALLLRPATTTRPWSSEPPTAA